MNLNEPVHLVFPYSGGAVRNGKYIGKHKETPEVSQEKIRFVNVTKIQPEKDQEEKHGK